MNQTPSFFDILFRCLSSKCPVCGQGRLFARLNQIQNFTETLLPVKTCDSCQFQFARQPGYFLGVATPILPILALFMGGLFAGVAYFGFHQEIEIALSFGALGIGIGFLIFFRTAIAFYIALDHAIDPPITSNHDSHQECGSVTKPKE